MTPTDSCQGVRDRAGDEAYLVLGAHERRAENADEYAVEVATTVRETVTAMGVDVTAP